MLSPFECLCGNFILPEPASYVFFYALFNLRKLLYIILLRRQIEASGKIGQAIFVEDINANAKGYEYLYRLQHSGR